MRNIEYDKEDLVGVKILETKWKHKAVEAIHRWLTDEVWSDEITRNTLKNYEYPPGPFTKFLYYFAGECYEAGWGVMVDFNERKQQIYLVNHYYKWMHHLRNGIEKQLNPYNP